MWLKSLSIFYSEITWVILVLRSTINYGFFLIFELFLQLLNCWSFEEQKFRHTLVVSLSKKILTWIAVGEILWYMKDLAPDAKKTKKRPAKTVKLLDVIFMTKRRGLMTQRPQPFVFIYESRQMSSLVHAHCGKNASFFVLFGHICGKGPILAQLCILWRNGLKLQVCKSRPNL